MRDRAYYRKLRRKAERFRVNLGAKNWCDLWHEHFDWEGKGNDGWLARRKHLRAVLAALRRARTELRSSSQPHQLFALVHPRSSGDDAVFVHTPNQNGTPFPHDFTGYRAVMDLPPLLAGRVDRSHYKVLSAPGAEGIYVVLVVAEPNPSIERTVSSGLCPLPAAAHVKR